MLLGLLLLVLLFSVDGMQFSFLPCLSRFENNSTSHSKYRPIYSLDFHDFFPMAVELKCAISVFGKAADVDALLSLT